ncbi:MAG: hypothetical protein FJ276_35415 [Planctomycetes bacterium]|nr:hypothetical protein [Planctomycetota bacterium]
MSVDKRRKQNGRLTEPDMPPRTIVDDHGVRIENLYCSQGDHAPPHLHVSGHGDEVRIGQNGKPLEHEPALSGHQREIVTRYRKRIRKALKKIGRWHWFHSRVDRRP